MSWWTGFCAVDVALVGPALAGRASVVSSRCVDPGGALPAKASPTGLRAVLRNKVVLSHGYV
ncbi:hypothetical protein KDX30_17255 [Pseudomonas sp. CDFA 553]|nr:hypothetical protein [Pseudomonas quasicaspiana]